MHAMLRLRLQKTKRAEEEEEEEEGFLSSVSSEIKLDPAMSIHMGNRHTLKRELVSLNSVS